MKLIRFDLCSKTILRPGILPMRSILRFFAACITACFLFSAALPAANATGWLNWRGPHQNGVSDETGLPDAITTDGQHTLWTYDLFGRGAAVVANGRVYA